MTQSIDNLIFKGLQLQEDLKNYRRPQPAQPKERRKPSRGCCSFFSFSSSSNPSPQRRSSDTVPLVRKVDKQLGILNTYLREVSPHEGEEQRQLGAVVMNLSRMTRARGPGSWTPTADKLCVLARSLLQKKLDTAECPCCLERWEDLNKDQWMTTPCCQKMYCEKDALEWLIKNCSCPLCRDENFKADVNAQLGIEKG